MVVMLKEKPILSSFRIIRVLSQVSVTTLRSDASQSFRLRTIIYFNTSGCLILGVGTHDFGKGGVKNGHGLVDLFFADDQRAQTLDHLAVVATGLDDQAVFKGFGANGGGGFAVRAIDADHHAATFDEQGVGAVAADNLLHALTDDGAFGFHAVGELIGGPEVFHRGRCGNEGMVVATESTVVLARLPLVQLTA